MGKLCCSCCCIPREFAASPADSPIVKEQHCSHACIPATVQKIFHNSSFPFCPHLRVHPTDFLPKIYTQNVAFSHHLFFSPYDPNFFPFSCLLALVPHKTVFPYIYMLCFLPPLSGIIGPSVISIFLGPPPPFLGLRQQRGGGKGSWGISVLHFSTHAWIKRTSGYA